MNVGDNVLALDAAIATGSPPGNICAGGRLTAESISAAEIISAVDEINSDVGLVNPIAAASSASPRASNSCKLISESSHDMMTGVNANA